MADFLPKTDSGLMAWTGSFNAKIGADPVSFGLTLAQATDYDTLQTAFVAAMALIADPLTKSPANTVAKNVARDSLVTYTRELVRLIQANPATTEFQRAELNINLRDNDPTPAPIPGQAPQMNILSVTSRLITIRLRDVLNPDSRAKPEDVASATIMYYVGDTPPSFPSEWTYGRETGQPISVLALPGSVPEGSKIWITAMWVNTRKQPGPLADPQSTIIAGGVAAAA